MQTIEQALDKLEKSKFRSSFYLTRKDMSYLEEKGTETVRRHAEDFVRQKLAPAFPLNDGKQTPMHGHPAFKAMHATACCCRGCLEKWYRIPKGRELTESQQARIVNLLMAWIERQQRKKDMGPGSHASDVTIKAVNTERITMEKRIRIQDTDLSLCPIGLGTVNAGKAWSGKAAENIFDAYLDNGGNLIDSARVYAAGRSEEVIGEWLKNSGKRDRVIIATKGGHPKYDSPEDDLHIPRMKRADMEHDIRESLKALQTDYIDIYFYHRDNVKQPVEEEIETMEDFRRKGLIRYYACSNWSAKRMEKADQYCREKGYRGFVADQALLNMGSKYMKPLPDDTLETIKGSIEEYHANNPQNLAMPYMGVASGFFHKYISNGPDSVKNSPYFTPMNVRIAERCKVLMHTYRVTTTQVVLGFFFSRPFACLPLYGPKNERQIVEALKTMDIVFDPSDYEM